MLHAVKTVAYPLQVSDAVEAGGGAGGVGFRADGGELGEVLA